MSMIILQNGNNETNIHYEFDPGQKPLGEGGMGRVYRGIRVEERETGFRKECDVAIKCLLEGLPDHAIERSRREASIRIKNDSLVEMIDFVEAHDGYTTHYHVISELLNGVNLDELLEGRLANHDGKPNATAERLYNSYRENRKAFVGEVFRKILSGIMALHDAGYIHRDIDPSNVMVTSDGKVKLIDFGIAKKVDELITSGKALTTPGQFVGKPHYAAPELILGDLQHQNYTTDVYALGIMLFQLVTGHLPFDGTHLDVCEKQTHEKLPLQDVQDKTVRKIIEKATEKDQRKRYQSAAEFRVDLDRWISEAPKSVKSYKPARPPKPSRSSSGSKPIGKWIGIAAAGLVIVGLVVYLATRPPKPPKQDDDPKLVIDTTLVKDTTKEELVETIHIATVEEAENLLMDKSTAKEGWNMLQQLVDNGNYQAVFLMSRIYFDASVTKDNKGNEFYSPNWKTMRENYGGETSNVQAHDLLMRAFEMNEDDVAILYELGCDFMWPERGSKRNLSYAKWCFQRVIDLTENDNQYRKCAKSHIDDVIDKTPNPINPLKPIR